ncbi:MAG: ABC transporter permease [Acidobacteria bacterium]|nr:ABC transporter permease [Acidobacteriota bacterium]
MRADLAAAIRALHASKTFTLVALVVLALGIGASTAIFSVVDAVVLRGLPFDEHDRLVAVGERRPPPAEPDPARDPAALSTASPQNYLDWAAQQDVFESFAATAGDGYTLYEPGSEPEDLRALRATADFFKVLRIAPAIGRPFTAENEVEGRHRVVVLSDSLWRRRFGGDPGIIGQTIPLEGNRYEVIGVLPPDVTYPVGAARASDLYVPYVVPPDERVRKPDWISIYLQTIGRLKPGVSLEQAQARMDQIAASLQAEHPEWNKDSLAGVRPLRDHIVGARTKAWMLMLLGAVGIVLLIACVNVATLQLARATAREREVGVRAALGAGRWRLIRQLLVENIVLSLAGTALAVLLAWWGVQVLKGSMPDGVARVSAIALDLRVLAVAALAAIVTGVLFGIAPALHLSKPDLTHALKDGARGTVGAARQRVRGALVVAEVALAVVLLVGAALFIGSFVTLMRIVPGFDTSNVLTAQVFPRFDPNQPPADNTAKFQDIVDRLSGAPGIEHASYVIGGMPLGTAMSVTTLALPGREPDREKDTVSVRRVSPDYHRALHIPLRAGRLFEPTDRVGSQLVVIVNESVARRFFPGQDSVGRAVKVNDMDRTIVGVVGDIHQTSLETDPLAEIYLPLLQGGRGAGELVIRTSGNPYDVLSTVKSAVGQVLPEVPLRNVRTMDEVLARRVAQRRFNMLLIGLFGLLGLVISAVGIYGTFAYTVSQRTREIGVRMALGASRSTVVGMVLRTAGGLVALGLVLGSAGAWALSATARTFLFGLEATDPRAYVAALAALGIAALVASVIPARRAATVDPVDALRAE